MKINETQLKEVTQFKNAYKQFKIEKRIELKQRLSNSETYTFEKPILKEDFRVVMREAKVNLKKQLKQTLNPKFFAKDTAQRVIEQQIVNLQNEYFKGLTKCERQVRKAKRIDKKDPERKAKITVAKTAIKNYKRDEKPKLKGEKLKLEANNGVNKVREFKNSTKIFGDRAMNKIIPKANRFANQRHVVAMRNGFMSTLPFTVIGALVMIVGTIPIGQNIDSNGIASLYTIMNWIIDVNPQLGNGLVIFQQLAMGLTALGIAFGVGIELGGSYGNPPLISGVMGLFGFVLWLAVPNDSEGYKLLLTQLGGKGIFAALITSIIMTEIYRIFKKYKITIRLPKQVPPAIGNSFIAFIPCMIYVLAVWGIKYGAGFDLINAFTNASGSVTNSITNSIGWACLIAIIPSLFWWLGIHGGSMLIFFTVPWSFAILSNQQWVLNGMLPSQVGMLNFYIETFFNTLCWMGGGGTLIGLAFSGLFFAKSRETKAIARASFVPALFNISEPIMFGYPVVLNIYFLIPFIVAPLGTVLIATPLMHWLGVYFVAAPQQLPSFILGLILTGQNWKGIIVAIIIAIWGTLCYLPFFFIYDRVKLNEERAADAKEAKELGITVRELLIKQETEKTKSHVKNRKLIQNYLIKKGKLVKQNV